MFIVSTYFGIAVSLTIVLALISTIRWQRRFGGFWPYSMLFVLFLIPVVALTIVESAMLSPASLQEMLFRHLSPDVQTIDQLRPLIIIRNNSLMIPISGFLFVLAALLGALTLAKARRLEKGTAETGAADETESP